MERPTRIKLLYFAGVRERLGTPEEELDLPAGVERVADLARFLAAAKPALDGVLASVRFAVGDEFAEPERRLASGDVVALLPPVSGG